MLTLWMMFGLALANPYQNGGLLAPVPAADASSEDPFRWQAPTAVVHPSRGGELALVLKVPPGHEAYRDMIAVTVRGEGLEARSPKLPEGKVHDAGEKREYYDADVTIVVPIAATDGQLGMREVDVEVQHQGCKGGLCYPRKTSSLKAWIRVTNDE